MEGVTLRLGTRGSLLARTQSGWVADAITAATGVAVELVVISTRGDRVTDRPLAQVGGKGLFTKEIEDAMLAGEVDLAVHSMKDMPTEGPAGLVIASIPVRADPRDALVGATLAELAPGAVVGTGSARRAAQLAVMRPDLEIRGIRGNVDTRVRKQRDGEYDAIVLAKAGLDRLGRSSDVTEVIPADAMVPAVGQGALAVQCRRRDADVLAVLERIHHPDTAVCVSAERSFMVTLEGGCSVPAACFARLDGEYLMAEGFFADDAGSRRLSLRSDPMHGIALGRELASRLRGGGGRPASAGG
ncbi:MAG: hydroxymethylbilane synthase [Myxococcota bacterium]|jgi:hydroxymethylbilane synthase